ncbi:group II intron reverse transcriptase/maturase [Paenibacillus medicaginis]|uniref:RNA-directed DNA polymerase n=1 Tax=Paenibacillus medicaginis TaxID=1470560 RepID=A0ABV5C9G5_9BACL
MNAGMPANYTKAKVRQLQTTLYLASKVNTKRRFHALYDKVYREDVMRMAWIRVKANGGSAGVDQETIDYIVQEYGEDRLIEECRSALMQKTYQARPVRRHEIPKGDGKVRPLGIPTVRDRVIQMATKIVIEPIFEADFRDNSFGFRPKRSIHDAINRIHEAVRSEKVNWVVDVDIQGYFDNIPHDKLMQMVKQRIGDRRILKLILMWLKAGVMKEGERFDTTLGSPQGGVISPLLANVYLHYLDTIWAKKFAHIGTIVRYADDLVILCRYKAQAVEAIQVLKVVFQKLELTMNTSKSKLVNLWEGKEGFDFLGHTHRRMPYWGKNGRILYYFRSCPSRKAMKKMRDKVKEAFKQRGILQWSLDDMIKHMNPKIQGWKNAYAKCDPWTANRFLAKVDWYIRRRFSLWWNRKHKKRKASQANLFALLPKAGLKSVTTWG